MSVVLLSNSIMVNPLSSQDALQLFFYGFSFIKPLMILLVQQFDENIKFKYGYWSETDPDSQITPNSLLLNRAV